MVRRLIISLVLGSLTAAAAHGANVTFDFTAMGAFATPQLVSGCLSVTADNGVNPANVNVLSLNGLGVVGGNSTITLDLAERMLFTFTGPPASGVRYTVGAVSNLNGNGTSGDAFIEAFDGGGASLGVLATSGSGTKNLSLLFGGAAISKFRVSANVDTQVITSVSYNNPSTPVTQDFQNLGTFTTSQLVAGPLAITALNGANPATVSVLNLNGLGVGSGGSGSGSMLDGNEALTFTGNGTALLQPVYFVPIAINANGNGTSGDTLVDAWDWNGTWLGSVPVTTLGPINLATLFGNLPFSKFRVRANGDIIRIGSLTYTAFGGATIDTTLLPTQQTARLATGPLIAHAMKGALSATLGIGNGVGLGVVGGASDLAIDGNEEATFWLDGSAAGAIDFTVNLASDLNGNAVAGNAFVEAYDGKGLSQGSVAISGTGLKDVGALFPGPLFSGFTVRADVDALTISVIHVTRQPGLFSFPVYGKGCPGTAGLTPRARDTALTPHGGSLITLDITQGKPLAPAFLFLGLARADLPMGFGCRFYLSPAFGPYGPFPLTAAGDFTFPSTILMLPVAATVTVQALIADSGVPAGFSATNGIEVNLQP